MKEKKLNNLLSVNDFTEKDLLKKVKSTKRTEVAKDIFESKKDSYTNSKGLNNLICLDDFSVEDFMKKSKTTKRTDVAKDILLEKKAKTHKDEEQREDEDNNEEKPKGLTPKQKKLPEALQKAILKRMEKSK